MKRPLPSGGRLGSSAATRLARVLGDEIADLVLVHVENDGLLTRTAKGDGDLGGVLFLALTRTEQWRLDLMAVLEFLP
jgi:hypothetical protein